MSAPHRSTGARTGPQLASAPAQAPAAAARTPTADTAQQAGLLALLDIETLVRTCRKQEQLHLVMTHEIQKVVRCRQCFLLLDGLSGGPQVASVSGLAAVDRTVPLVRAIERLVGKATTDASNGDVRTIALRDDDLAAAEALSAYPFECLLWVPLASASGRVLGGLLLARETAWSDADFRVCERLADPFAYALEALRRQPVINRRRLSSMRTVAITALGAAIAMAIPVPMTALAPLEVAARDALIVTAGMDGVIETVEVEPSTTVQAGQLLARLVDIIARNKLELAEREVVVAEARIKKWQQMSFGDPRASHELAIADAELRLRGAERDWAKEQMTLTEIRAAKSGVTMFLDKKDLIGKPVAVGEKIMEIADPDHVEARIDLSVADALILRAGARTKLFLDSDPLRAREARIAQADYQARVKPNNTLVLRAIAHLGGDAAPVPRLGTRGMAQVFGADVPLGYYLFRRPISALRQWSGL